jgi:hypothetical protein
MPRRFLLLLVAAAIATAAIACGGDDDEPDVPTAAASATVGASATPDVEATQTAEPQPTATATPTAGGIDAIVAAARANDATALEALVVYAPVPCTTDVMGVGGPPPCEPGEADGTPVDVVFATTCEGYYARESALNFNEIAFGVFGSGDALYGLYEIDPASQLARIEEWSAARYAVVMNRIGPADQNFAYVIISDGERIIGTAAGCGETPEEWVDFQGLSDAIAVP